MTEIEMIAKIRRSIEVAEDALAMAKLALYRLAEKEQKQK